MKELFVFLLLFSFSCQDRPKEIHNSDNKTESVIYDHYLGISDQDSLLLKDSGRRTGYPEYFDSTYSFCKIERDTIKLFLTPGMFGSYHFDIKIVGDTLYPSLKYFDDYSDMDYTPTNAFLVLNDSVFKPDSYLIAKINFSGIGRSIHEPGRKDTLMIQGKIKLKVRDSNFTFADLYIENERNAFFSLFKQKPDTITKLNLYGCAFTELPIELSYFTNLKELNLDGNDLSNANFDLLADLKTLINLNLSFCNLSKFPTLVLKLTKLENLSVWGNKLTVIPDGLYNLTALKELIIGNNNLKYLSPKISKLKNLESFETSSTDIRRYPDEMTTLKKLVQIYPSDTMRYIPKPLKRYIWGCDTIFNR